MWNCPTSSHSPSWTIASSSGLWPIVAPHRASFTRYGAWDIDSCAPATTIDSWPARIASNAIVTAFIPDAHTLLTVTAPPSPVLPEGGWGRAYDHDVRHPPRERGPD